MLKASHLPRIALGVLLLVLVISPAAAQAAPMYSVSLSASAKKDVISASEVRPPSDCLGKAESIERGFVSGRITAKPSKLGSAFSRSGLGFGGKFAGLTGEAINEGKGGFTLNPSSGVSEDSAGCADAFKAAVFTSKCKKFTDVATTNGAPFELSKVKGGKLGLRFTAGDVAIDCNADNLGGTFLSEPVSTSLKLSVVKGLGVGGTASASGKTVFESGPAGVDVTTALTYNLKVTREK